MKERIREIVEKVYTDGLIDGSESTAIPNFLNSNEATDKLLEIIKSEEPEVSSTYNGTQCTDGVYDNRDN